MSASRVCIIYDDRDRPETTGGYCLRALQELTATTHIRPDEAHSHNPADYDLFLRVDDGLDYSLPDSFHPLAWWAIDTHLDLGRCLTQAKSADLTFAAQQPGAKAFCRAGIDAEWLPLACDPGIHRQHDVAKQYDFCFVGNLFPGPRTELVGLLGARFPNHFVGRAYFDEMSRKYSASRTVFNRSIRDDVNMRVFEALACGSLLITNQLPPESGQGELFHDGAELATYREGEELLDKIRFYLTRPEPRARVERAGREFVLAKHTYRHRMQRVLEAAGQLTRSVTVSSIPQTPLSDSSNTSPSVLSPAPVFPSADPGFNLGYFDFDRPELLALIPITVRDVVDVGCGSGRLGESLKMRQPCRVVGLEQNPAAAVAARKRLDLVMEGDVESLDWPFPPASFDAVVCGDVLEHLRDPLGFLKKVRQWLRPEGLLITSLPNVRHHSVIRGLLAGDWTYESAGLLDNTHLRFFTRREIEKLLYRAGFEVPVLIPVPGPGYAEWEAAGRPGQVAVGGLRIGPLQAAEAREFYTYQWLAAAPLSNSHNEGLTSIVVLTHNQLPLTRCCIDSIRLVTDEPYELVLVDNGSTDGTPQYFQALAATENRVTVILNPDNRGFPAGMNQGIRAARGDQVLLLNNDTIATTSWLKRMLHALHSSPMMGLVGPCSNRVSGSQQVPVSYENDLGGLDGFAWEWGKSHDRVTEETDRLVGFCLLIKRSVIDRIGFLDEGFGIGNFEDDDYVLRTRQAGFKTVIARDAFVHHFGGATFVASGVNYAALMRQNAKRFESKWGSLLEGQNGKSSLQEPEKHKLQTGPPDTGSPKFAASLAVGGGLLLELNRPRLSGCLIVRDNAKTIRACLGSLRPWVDELVVVDTGSKDDTSTIAAEYGARVFHFPWVDDFSAARNESVRHASGEWIFWMDSDDTIDEKNGRGLRELALSRHPERMLGYVIRVHCPGAGPSGDEDLTVVDHVKLFRNRSDLRFEHRIHEQILPAIRRADGDVGWTNLFVVHSGYDHSPEGQKRKKERDLRLLHQELTEKPGHPFTLFNLGMTYADVGEPVRAIGYLESSLSASQPGESHRRKTFSLLAHSQNRTGNLAAALSTCETGLKECPDDLELRFRLGVLLHEAGRLRESAEKYEQILTWKGDRYFTSVDRGIGGFKARQNLALVYGEMGDLDKAESAWRSIIDDMPAYRPGWRGLGDLLLRRGKLDEAQSIAKRLSIDSRLALEGYLITGRIAEIQNRPLESRTAWEAAREVDPSDPEPLRLLGKLHFETGEDGPAEQILRRLIELSPDDPSAHHNLGTVLLRTQRAAESVGVFQRSLELRPDSITTRLFLGYALAESNDRAGAASAWRTVLTAEPNHREAVEALKSLSH